MPLQRRLNPEVSFYRSYDTYVAGFGDPLSDYWMSLTEMHNLTAAQPAILYLRFVTMAGGSAWAIYDSFAIGDAGSNFLLTVSGYRGTAGDCLEENNGSMFSTPDADNDLSTSHCASVRNGGFWFGDTSDQCGGANPNGKLGILSNEKFVVHWFYYNHDFQEMRYFEMMMYIRN